VNKAISIGIGITLIVIACLLHSFYISYHYARNNFIVSWTASNTAYNSYINEYAKKLVKADTYKVVAIPSLDERLQRRKQFIRDYCSNYKGVDDSSWEYFVDSSNPDKYACRQTWIEPKVVTKRVLDEKGVGIEEAIAQLKRNNPSIEKGMTPSKASAGENPSRTATARSLWLGIILPIALVAAGISLLAFGVLGLVRRQSPSVEKPSMTVTSRTEYPHSAGETERYIATPCQPAAVTLGDLLKQHFGKDLCVAGGSAKRDDPLVITELVDYVSIEYDVAKFLMQGLEYKKEKQQLLNLKNRKVDELIFATKRVGAPEWENIRRFYFDITDGFSQLGN